MPPKVTVLIPFYNCPYVDRAIESALQQTYPNVDIIVIDDGSTEYTSLVRPYANYVRRIHKANGGTASALNLGMRYARGAYIAWLSSDDLFYADKLESQMAFMSEHQASASYTNFDVIDHEGQLITASAAAQFPTKEDFFRHLLWGNPINGCTVIVTRELLEKFDPFDETLPFTHDFDMWYRILLSGTDIHFMDKSTVQYRKHDRSGSVRHQEQMMREVALTKERYESQIITRLIELQREP